MDDLEIKNNEKSLNKLSDQKKSYIPVPKEEANILGNLTPTIPTPQEEERKVKLEFDDHPEASQVQSGDEDSAVLESQEVNDPIDQKQRLLDNNTMNIIGVLERNQNLQPKHKPEQASAKDTRQNPNGN